MVVLSLMASLVFADSRFGPAIDPVCTLIFLLWSSYFSLQILRSSLSDLLDISCEEAFQLLVLRVLAQTFDKYDAIHAIRTRRSGDQVFVEIELGFKPDISLYTFDRLARTIRGHIHEQRPDALVSVVPQVAVAEDRSPGPVRLPEHGGDGPQRRRDRSL